MSNQQSKFEYQGDEYATRPAEADEKERMRLARAEEERLEKQALEEVRAMLGGGTSNRMEQQAELEFLREEFNQQQQHIAKRHQRERVSQHLNRARGMLEAGGDCAMIFRELFYAIEDLS